VLSNPHAGAIALTMMVALNPGVEIGAEVHADRDQFFWVEKGKGEVVIDGNRTRIRSDDAILVPSGARHNVINTGDKPLKLYTLYRPPERRDGIVRATKAYSEGRILCWAQRPSWALKPN